MNTGGGSSGEGLSIRSSVLLVVVMLWLGVGPVRAAGDPVSDGGFDRTGAYLGLGGVYALENFDRGFDDSAGINLRFGYRVLPHTAFELSYEWLEGFDSTGRSPEVELDTHLISVNAKLLALSGRFAPYALLGGGLLIVNTELFVPGARKPYDVDTGLAARFGGGLDLALGEHLVLNLEGTYVVPTAEVKGEKYGTLGMGLQFRF